MNPSHLTLPAPWTTSTTTAAARRRSRTAARPCHGTGRQPLAPRVGGAGRAGPRMAGSARGGRPAAAGGTTAGRTHRGANRVSGGRQNRAPPPGLPRVMRTAARRRRRMPRGITTAPGGRRTPAPAPRLAGLARGQRAAGERRRRTHRPTVSRPLIAAAVYAPAATACPPAPLRRAALTIPLALRPTPARTLDLRPSRPTWARSGPFATGISARLIGLRRTMTPARVAPRPPTLLPQAGRGGIQAAHMQSTASSARSGILSAGSPHIRATRSVTCSNGRAQTGHSSTRN